MADLSIDLTDNTARAELAARVNDAVQKKPSLIGVDRVEMAKMLAEAGVPQKQCSMRASQLWHWIYVVCGFTAFERDDQCRQGPARARLNTPNSR